METIRKVAKIVLGTLFNLMRAIIGGLSLFLFFLIMAVAIFDIKGLEKHFGLTKALFIGLAGLFIFFIASGKWKSPLYLLVPFSMGIVGGLGLLLNATIFLTVLAPLTGWIVYRIVHNHYEKVKSLEPESDQKKQ